MSFRPNLLNLIVTKCLKVSSRKLVLAKINSRQVFLGVKFKPGKVLVKTRKTITFSQIFLP